MSANVSDTRWLTDDEVQAWRRLQLMHLQLSAALSRELAETSGLSYQDYLVLATLTDRAEGRMRAFELERELGWEKSKLSHHISRMTDRRLVTRQKCATDRRGTYVVITKRGRRTIAAAAPRHVENVRRRFVDLLTPAQLAAISAVAGTVLDNLAKECATLDAQSDER